MGPRVRNHSRPSWVRGQVAFDMYASTDRVSESPGRIHHCMRSIGYAQRALNLLLQRVTDPGRKTFGKFLYQHGNPCALHSYTKFSS